MRTVMSSPPDDMPSIKTTSLANMWLAVNVTTALTMVSIICPAIRCSRGQRCSSAEPPYHQTLGRLLLFAHEHLLLFAYELRTFDTLAATLGGIWSRMSCRMGRRRCA